MAIHDINKPAEFVIFGAITIIAERHPEIERHETVDFVGRLDGSVEHLGRTENHRRIARGIPIAGCSRIGGETGYGLVARPDWLASGFLVSDVDVADAEESQKPGRIGCSRVAGRHHIGGQLAVVLAGTPLPGTVAIDRVIGEVRRHNRRRVGRQGDRRNRPLARSQQGSVSGKWKQ